MSVSVNAKWAEDWLDLGYAMSIHKAQVWILRGCCWLVEVVNCYFAAPLHGLICFTGSYTCLSKALLVISRYLNGVYGWAGLNTSGATPLCITSGKP